MLAEGRLADVVSREQIAHQRYSGQSHPGCFSLSESSIRGVMGLEVRFLAVLREEFP